MESKRVHKDRFAKIHNLASGKDRLDVKNALNGLTKYLSGVAEDGSLAISVKGSGRWIINISSGETSIQPTEDQNADVEIFLNEKTAFRIARGRISPVMALGTENMRIRGNTDFAIKIYEKLAADDGLTDPCRRRK